MTDETARPTDEGAPISTTDPSVDDAAVERALRAGLADFELSPEDQALLEAEGPYAADGAAQGPLPVVAVVGRPNVGKSSLVNRILRRREAVVEDVPGVTRDRVSYEAEWAGRRFTVVDTGGWEADATGIHLRVAEQAEIAIDLADVVMFVVDATVGATDDDEAVVKLLRRSGKPVVLVANKVDDQRGEADAAMLWSLGLGQPWPVSAVHGRGSGDALDAVLEVLPDVSAHGAYAQGGPRRVALVGRPNVGKSSLLNRLAGAERVVVDNVAGTTRDPVDELIELGGKTWRFVDTAGIRRRVHQTPRRRLLRLAAHPDRPREGRGGRRAHRRRGADRRAGHPRRPAGHRRRPRPRHRLQQVGHPRRGAPLLPRARDRARSSSRCRGRRGPTSRPAPAATWTGSCPPSRPRSSRGTPASRPAGSTPSSARSWPPTRTRVRGGKQPRILFATQASTRPPRFVIFASGFIEAGYRRFIERRLREQFGFEGTPIEVSVRVREKRAPLNSSAGDGSPSGADSGPAARGALRFLFAPRGIRAVAQLGSALDWGSRGRRFKSCQPDRLGPDLFTQVRPRFHVAPDSRIPLVPFRPWAQFGPTTSRRRSRPGSAQLRRHPRDEHGVLVVGLVRRQVLGLPRPGRGCAP